MTGAVINLTDDNNRLLNLIKAQFDLKNKSDAVNFALEAFAKENATLQVRPEYIRKLQKIMKQKGKAYASAEDMFKGFERHV